MTTQFLAWQGTKWVDAFGRLISPTDGTPAWTPSALGFVARPTGTDYVTIESLGVGSDLRAAAVHPDATGKILTLPEGLFTLYDFVQGDGAKFMHGLMLNPSVNTHYIRGIVGSGSGTVLQMVANSSHFTSTTALSTGSSGSAYLESMIQWYGVNNVEFGNLAVTGTDQPHLYHGVRILGDNAHVHHVKFTGASRGDYNSPPGETNDLVLSGSAPLVEDCEFDGRADGVAATSSSVGVNSATNSVFKRVYMHDMKSGFGIAMWQSTGLSTEDMWVVRPGTGAGGYNGAHTNHEHSGGTIRHLRPHLILDGYWGSPRRNAGKFGHMTFWNTDNASAYADAQVIDPVFDTWGGIPGGFAITVDTITAMPTITRDGISLTPVVRPQWWIDSPTINTSAQYWVTNVTGDGSVWG